MAKGVYKIEKYRAELIDGEWVKVELVDTIDNIENRMTADYAVGLYDGDYWSNNTQTIVAISEAIFAGAHSAAPNLAPWVRGAQDSATTFTPAAGMDDAFYETITIVQPGASTRLIRSLCLTSSGSTGRCSSIVSLSSPCTQTDSEILQVTYRITADVATLQANSQTSGVIAEDLFARGMYATTALDGSSIYDTNSVDAFVLNIGAARWGDGIAERCGNLVIDNNEILRTVNDAMTVDWNNGMTRRVSFDARFGIGDSSGNPGRHCGFPIKGVGIGNGTGEGMRHISSVQKGTTSSVQNIYGRTADDSAARRPYLDASFIATSAATVSLVDSGGEWVNYLEDSYNMPYLYRVTIELGGAVGAATYKLRRRKLVHWYANAAAWEPAGLPIPTINWIGLGVVGPMSDDGSTNRHGQIANWQSLPSNTGNLRYDSINDATKESGFIHQRYMYPEGLFFDYTGITIHNVDSQYANLDTNSTPALSVTGLLQVATDGSTIYAADEDTGLYRIEREIADYTTSNYTITTPAPPGITDTTSCRGVTTGYSWQEGSISKIRVVFGGANYAVADTVSIVGVNGTSATAEVGAVDGDGAITSVTITVAGSGYIQDNIQAYVSSGSGVGAGLKAEVGTNGELWALFDDTTDAFLYLAHATSVGSNDWTSGLTFATAGDTITNTDGTSFITDGFRAGQELFITGAEDAGNNGLFTITVVTALVITVSENLTNSTGADTTAQLRGVAWEIMTETITDDSTNIDFLSAGPDTITGDGTSFITQGFREGMKIVISLANTGANDGIYTIAGVTATVITLDQADVLATDANDAGAVMSTLTDFTLTNYTSGSPGRTGSIGLMWDREHADGRFAMLTPATKNNNDGTGATTAATFSWWSFANSTGTTTAGATDFILTTNHNDAAGLGVEQLATQCIAPMNNDNLWIGMGDTGLQSGSWTFGVAGITETNASTGYIGTGRVANLGMKDKTMDTVIPGLSTAQGTNALVYRKNTAQFNTSTTFEGVLANQMVDRITTWSPNYHNQGGPFSSFGEGMLTASLNNPNASGNAYCVWGFNGDGTLAGAGQGEEQLPYGTWDEFGWDGTRWVLGNAGAKTTHSQSTFSGNTVNINHTNGTMLGAGFASTDWAGDGFSAGDLITVTLAEDDGNNGGYVIESLSGTTLTITPYSNTLTNTNTDDTTAVIVADDPLLDGLGISFDTTGGVLVIGEYYDGQVLDGILNDNATTASWDTIWYEGGNESGTTISDADHIGVTGSTVTTAPSGDIGFVTAEPWGANDTGIWFSNFATVYWSEPGMVTNLEVGNSAIMTGEQNLGTGDFALRFRVTGSHTTTQAAVGLVPWASILGATITNVTMDDNLIFDHDLDANPTSDIYNIEVRSTGNGGVVFTENADRIVTIAAQDETLFDNSPTSEGTFVGGNGVGGGGAHVINDILTMDDGSTITVDNIDVNDDVTEFTITTSSTRTRGRTEVGVGSNDYTNLDLDSGTNDITINGGTDFVADGFKVGMKLVIYSATEAANNGIYTITAVSTTILTLAESITTTNATDAAVQINSAIVQTGSDGVGTDFALILGTDNEAAAAVEGDEYTIARVGAASGNIRYSVNGVEFFRTAGAVNTDFGLGIWGHDNADGWTVYDIEMDYTINRRLRCLGNGTTTGAHNPNFMCHPFYTVDKDFTVQIAGVDATINNDGATSPSLGAVTLLPRTGRIWFNSGDDGKTVTVTWRTTHIINLT